MRGLWRLAEVDKMWKTICGKARNSQGFSVTLGRGGRVMRSPILYYAEIRFGYMNYFSYLCIVIKVYL
jgi:hypothetical protein